MKLTPEEIQRYSRHLTLPNVGIEGQERLKESSALLVGAGGLGAPLALYLAAAGVGRIGLVDFDTVDVSNLQRQVLYGVEDIGRPKLEAAKERLQGINPHIQIEVHEVALTSENALGIISQYDLVADGTDNFATRYLVNDACILTGRPNVYGSIFRFEGQVSVFGAPDGPCYRCIYPEPPPPGMVPSCAEGGVLGVLPGMVGTLQANEAIKLLLGIGEPLIGRLMLVDALSMKIREWKVPRDPECPVCGEHPTVKELIDYEEFCGIPKQKEEPTFSEITVQELQAKGDARPFLLDVRKPYEAEIASLGADLLIPLDELPARLDELDPYKEKELIVHCRSGGRSAQAVKMLLEAGFANPINLKGGTLAWSEEVDASVATY
ncbi:MAG: molybdopterin-synthase adenylyltransferase MoeB [Rhodothermaceae bacterium]|nr:molybdopterin-synthase adenylyltransferase MoeB [Rhodothermaceae bacterium]